MYELRFDKKALEFIQKLDKPTVKRIWAKLQQCKEDPFRYLGHLTDIKGHKLRIGDYRLVIDVDEAHKIVWVLKAGHRKNIYD